MIAAAHKEAGLPTGRAVPWGFLFSALAISGGLVCAGQVLWWSSLGAWPFHDTAAYWLAGVHFRHGIPPYSGDVNFLTMLYAPPWVVLMAPVSLLPLEVVEVGFFVGQVLGLRYIAGSWRMAGLLAWLPFVPRELVTGNVDLMMAAAILMAVRRGPAAPVALFALAKFAPIIALIGGRWREGLLALAGLLLLTVPFLWLWPQWVELMIRAQSEVGLSVPFLPRLPIVALLILYRKPWAIALAAALATPGFYFHSAVLLIPAGRLFIEQRLARA